MEINFDSTKARPIHQIINIVKGMCLLQISGGDVMIPALVGDGGIGKTAMLQEMCAKNDFNLLDIHYGLKPQEEISGLPDFSEPIDIQIGDMVIHTKNTNWTLPDMLGQAYKLASNNKPTVIFFDDWHSSSPANMLLGYEIFTERKLRGYPFPKNCAFVLAMNQQGAKDLANTIPAPIVNRMAMFKVIPDFGSWKTNFAIPNNINSKVVSFLSNSKYTKYFQQAEQVNKPWASARSWTKLSGLLNPLEELESNGALSHSDILYYSEAHIGDAAASEFAAYYKLFGEVNAVDIFNGNLDISIPSELTKQYIFMLATTTEFLNRYSKSDIVKAKKEEYMGIMAQILAKMGQKASEICVIGFREIMTFADSKKFKNLYHEIRSRLTMLDPDVAAKITNDVINM